MDISKFKDVYISEAEDHLQKLNDNMLSFEKDQTNLKLLDELMRSSHTLKSSSAAMGYKKTSFLTHVMEDIFDYARNKYLVIDKKTIASLFDTVDALTKSINEIKKSGKEFDVDPYTQNLKDETGVQTEGTGVSPRDKDGKPILKKKIDKVPKVDSNQTTEIKKKGVFPLGGELAADFEKVQFIKVPIHRLDSLMDLMEELIIDKMRLQNTIDSVVKRENLTAVEIVEKYPLLPKIKPTVDHLSRLITSIQYQIMESRLVPLEQIFARFPRLVRDMAAESSKEIDLKLIGNDIELDRTVVDKLGEPLIHLIKNAVDHGIETKGTLSVRATREKEVANVIVEDSGSGIPWQKVAESAVKKGIVTRASTDRHELEKLLFHPKLSTSEKVTQNSGRGIGLSVVKEFVERINGRVIVESPLEKGGTRFTLELPLTLAIINALLVSIKNSTYALPFTSVDKSVHIPLKEIKSMADQDIAVVGGVDIPLIHVNKLFTKNEYGINEQSEENIKNGLYTVIVRKGKDLAGIVVDKLENEQEIIVKPLSPILRKVKGFSGSTILGDGTSALIIDINTLLEDTRRFTRN